MDFAAAKGPKLTLDEGSVLDIGACIVDGNNLAPGRAIPDDGDPRIDHSLEGFLFTCGPDHIRHPQPMSGAFEGKRYPLHGSFSSHPAKVLWTRFEDGNAECRADIDIVTAEHRTARLERHWRIDGATGEVSLTDRVVNTTIEAMPVFLMYHMNVGGKWFDDGVRLSGRMLENGGFPWTFGEELGGLFLCAGDGEGRGLVGSVSRADRRHRRQIAAGTIRYGYAAVPAGLAQPARAGACPRHRAGFASLDIARRAGGGG